MKEKSPEKQLAYKLLQNHQNRSLSTKFKKFKEQKILPQYKIEFQKCFKGKLFEIIPKKHSGDWYEVEENNQVNFRFFKKDRGLLGVYQKRIPVGEIVIATGQVAKFLIKEDQSKQNAMEVLTTRGVGFVLWSNLKLAK